MAVISEIVVDCKHAPSLARFWAEVLDEYDVRDYDDAEIARLAEQGLTPDSDPMVAVDGPGPTMFFQQVPEEKVVKNRVHVDVKAVDRAAEVDRLVALGATVFQVLPRWTTLLDLEGNEFCVFGQD